MKPFFRFFAITFILFFLLNWLSPKWTKTSYPRLPVPNFSASIRGDYQAGIEQNKPQVLLMGNSVLIDGMDDALFSKMTGMKSMTYLVEGGATAQYYLMIKNVVLKSAYRAEYLLLFFLDNTLTSPGLWTTGTTFVNRIDEVAGENETTLLDKAYLRMQHPVDVFVNGNIPAFGERQTIKSKINNHLKYTLPGLLDDCNPFCVDRGIESIFNFGNINRFPITPLAMDLHQWTGQEWDFNALVGDSFLPDMIEMTRQNGIKFILIREKNARAMTYEDETDDMRQYFAQLAAYLQKEKVPYIDLSHAPELTRDMFHDMMHVRPVAKSVYTRLAAEGFLKVLESQVEN